MTFGKRLTAKSSRYNTARSYYAPMYRSYRNVIPKKEPPRKTERIKPLTPEAGKAWDARKFEQGQRIILAEIFEGLDVSMVQTKHTFTIAVSRDADDGRFWSDELVIGDPAKTIIRDDRLYDLRAVDLSDDEIRAAFAEWRAGRRLPPAPSRLVE